MHSFLTRAVEVTKNLLRPFRRLIFKWADEVSIVGTVIIIAITIFKLNFLSSKQLEVTKAIIDISAANTFATEAVWQKLRGNRPELQDNFIEHHLKNANDLLVDILGKNQPICVSKGVLITVRNLEPSPISDLASYYEARSMKQADGQSCENPWVEKGKINIEIVKSDLSEWAETIIALVSILLIWTQIERYFFEKKFASRRRNEGDIPYYLAK